MDGIKINAIPTKTEEKTVEVNGYLLHSKYNPKKEAKAFVEKEYQEHYLHILFGYGLGYIANELQQKVEVDTDLIIIDPLKEYLCAENSNVLSFENKKEIEIHINKGLINKNSKIKVICSPNYDKIASKQYVELLNIIKTIQISDKRNLNTVEYFAKSWQENYIKNMIFACNDVPFEMISNKFTHPVVIAAGGPSLTKQIQLLKQYKEKIIIIAAGSTINSLLKANLEPDFVVSIDGGEENFNHFKDIKSINAPLIYCLSNHYEIQENYPTQRIPFLALKDRYINNILGKCNRELPLFLGGTSVANFAFEIAQKITNGPIALIGQDLAYTNNMTHADANKHAMKIDDEFSLKRKVFEIEGYYGDMVLTDNVFVGMKDAFEQLIEISNHSSKIFNCTEGGAKIKGFEQMAFKDFLKEFATTSKEEIKLVINNTNEANESLKKLIKQYHSYNESLEIIEKDLRRAKLLIKKEQSYITFSNDLIRFLKKTEKKIQKIFENEKFSHILQPINNRIISNYKPKSQESESEKFNRVYEQTLDLYSSLLEAVILIQKYLKESLQLIKE